ncbi:carboxylesterase family protein [Streptomyces violaceusniger]|uniref:carboxylesterase family protein n=1 Tax=Streptomyces violaceusniger TaxID=68280 RepID=UPI0001E4C0E5|nr:carboxylesterase family protein [Streptomyces violaceusniger]
MADHHAAGGNATYVYQFDYRPAHDPGHLGATHCGELSFLFGTFDSYPDSPMLGSPSVAERAMGRAFGHGRHRVHRRRLSGRLASVRARGHRADPALRLRLTEPITLRSTRGVPGRCA